MNRINVKRLFKIINVFIHYVASLSCIVNRLTQVIVADMFNCN